MSKIIHMDLFSGIGGFALAVEEVWPDAEHIFCEIDPYCQALLKKRFEGSVIYGDIRELTADTYRHRLQEQRPKQQTSGDRQLPETVTDTESRKPGVKEARNGRQDTCGRSEEGIFILTGGFPCQPFSQAGKRKGTSDNRFLWPEMLRVIHEFKPTWVIAENVRGILTIEGGLVFEQVCLDLEASGYEVQPFIIPAVAVNAPHRRDRVWFVANRRCEHGERAEKHRESNEQKERSSRSTSKCSGDVINSESKGLPDRDAGKIRGQAENQERERPVVRHTTTEQFNQNWFEVATEYGRMDDGISDWMDRCIKTILGGDYAARIDKNQTENLRILFKEIQQEEVWRELGRFNTVEEKEILLSFLRRIEKESVRQNNISSKSKKIQGNNLFGLWKPIETRMSPQGREYQEQCAKKFENIVPSLSHETALEIAKAWNNLSFAYSSYISAPAELHGLKLSKSRHRVERLKALGNAIVPQVAVEIMMAIKQGIIKPEELR